MFVVLRYFLVVSANAKKDFADFVVAVYDAIGTPDTLEFFQSE